ncbi:MAG: non-ribosomal peptide synthetase [Rhodanobacteraceae bacterium]|nr:non-ribosomal peptide synthetase [Rhodanobacteraceae bacterium]
MSLEQNGWDIVERLRAIARHDGARCAIRCGGRDIAYAALDRASDDLALRLRGGDIAVIDGERSAELVVAALACVKARVAFYLVGENQPEDYTARTLEVLPAVIWITASAAGDTTRAERIAGGRVRALHRLEPLAGDALDARRAASTMQFDATAPSAIGMYLVATSGTTGRPRLVCTPAAPLEHFIAWYTGRFELGEHDRFSMLSGLGYDPLLRDMFVPLTLGACLVVPGKDVLGRRGGLRAWVREERISVLHATPQIAELIFGEHDDTAFDALRLVAVGGSSLSRRLVATMRAQLPHGRVVNVYGTSETPQIMTCHVCSAADENGPGAVPVGAPIDAVRVHVRDRGDTDLKPGQVGEIQIETPYLSLGYVGDAAATAAKFGPGTEPGWRTYMTGDLGHIDSHGSLHLSGRRDRQVKCRGHRVQLEDVERALSALPPVAAAAVMLEHSANGGRLVAYLEYRTPTSTIEIKRELLRTLPAHMVPEALVVLERMPLGSGNKIDYAALEDAPRAAAAGVTTAADADSRVTRELLAIWSDVLGVSAAEISLNSNFFDIGGTSLLSAKVIAQINGLFERQLNVADLFVYSNIGELAQHIARDGSKWEPASDPSRTGKRAGRINQVSMERHRKAQKQL